MTPRDRGEMEPHMEDPVSPVRSDNNVTRKDHADADAHRVESTSPPDDTESLLPRWNHPRSNIFRVFATLWVFLVMGANDAAYGVRYHRSECA